MTIIDQKFVYRDGANSSSAPISGFRLADLASELTTGVEGDLAYAKDTDKVYKYTGSSWIDIASSSIGETSGLWTPVIGGSGGESGQSYSSGVQEGHWVRLGSIVTFSCFVQLGLKGTISGSIRIKGLPYTAKRLATFPMHWQGLAISKVTMICRLPSGVNYLDLYAIAGAQTSVDSSMTTTDITNTSLFATGGSYIAN